MVTDVAVTPFGVFYVNPSNGGLDPKDSASLTPFTTKYSDEIPLMQFTGLKDKSGVEIYENDVCKFASGRVRTIFFMAGGFGYYMDRDYADYDKEFIAFAGHSALAVVLEGIEVIGNIHQNPDLL